MIEFIVLLSVSVLSLAVLTFQLLHLQRAIARLKFKIMQNGIGTKMLYKKLETLEMRLETQGNAQQAAAAAAAITPPPSVSVSGMPDFLGDEIEQQYLRARKLAKSGRIPAESLQKSCKLTEEEYELLMETLHAE
ncbi:hypothetical protein Lgee_0752 [Legionella geestiana]|uniref:Uncharacterized protein n=1 Tax=Legionella geestiana TaxID=45065 RepID=A0A0W0U2W9_9GAMM|nr:hypothetical protein [Legionella geestiana]KTD02060.1 hypothetical protein Lgee_0752 [Legionella geestiana]QBS11859.1 hypothetical protein E4T54_03340 [Legionella geestiana]QDQ40529.1 hypothetical protein E3226_009085 [Legionella geestiana]STX53444.1 Uncharacterised protein [Legionella geestiana]